MTKKEILNFLFLNKNYIKEKFNVKNIYLVGSYARGEEKVTSDIDIMVEMKPDFDNYFDLKYFLEKKLQKKVDLLLENNIRHLIKKNLEKDKINV